MGTQQQEQAPGASAHDELIDPKAVAALGSISVATLHRIRKRDPGFPDPVPLPIHSLRWRRSDIARYFGLIPQEAGQ